VIDARGLWPMSAPRLTLVTRDSYLPAAEDPTMSTFVIVHGAWGSPAEMEPVVAPLESAGHAAITVDLPCVDAGATLEQYAAAVRAVLPEDPADVVLVGHSFGGFTVSTIAAENVGMSVAYVAAWIPQPGVSVIDLFLGSDPFADGDEDAGIAAFGGMIASAGAGRCALDIDHLVAAVDPSAREAIRSYLEQTQRPQGIAALRQKWNGDLPVSGRRTYVVTTADTIVPPGAQRAMAASVGADVVEIDTGHSPFSEQPARLAELLVATTR
jgi:pimeloyl-ACP methyl ester carboxylesterase